MEVTEGNVTRIQHHSGLSGVATPGSGSVKYTTLGGGSNVVQTHHHPVQSQPHQHQQVIYSVPSGAMSTPNAYGGSLAQGAVRQVSRNATMLTTTRGSRAGSVTYQPNGGYPLTSGQLSGGLQTTYDPQTVPTYEMPVQILRSSNDQQYYPSTAFGMQQHQQLQQPIGTAREVVTRQVSYPMHQQPQSYVTSSHPIAGAHTTSVATYHHPPNGLPPVVTYRQVSHSNLNNYSGVPQPATTTHYYGTTTPPGGIQAVSYQQPQTTTTTTHYAQHHSLPPMQPHYGTSSCVNPACETHKNGSEAYVHILPNSDQVSNQQHHVGAREVEEPIDPRKKGTRSKGKKPKRRTCCAC